MLSRSTYVVSNGKISFFLWLNNIPIYVYMTLSIHIFFMYSSINGHLGCFHVLATVNNAAINLGRRTAIFSNSYFLSYQINTQKCNCWIIKSLQASTDGGYECPYLPNKTLFTNLSCIRTARRVP